MADPDAQVFFKMPFEMLFHKVKIGHAWAGDRDVSAVDVSIDFGASWQRAELAPPPNAGSWQTWNTEVSFPKAGYYEVWARATDEAGLMQPMVVPGWNPRGYLNNSCHRIAVTVA